MEVRVTPLDGRLLLDHIRLAARGTSSAHCARQRLCLLNQRAKTASHVTKRLIQLSRSATRDSNMYTHTHTFLTNAYVCTGTPVPRRMNASSRSARLVFSALIHLSRNFDNMNHTAQGRSDILPPQYRDIYVSGL